jgi:hypothetical protein
MLAATIYKSLNTVVCIITLLQYVRKCNTNEMMEWKEQ